MVSFREIYAHHNIQLVDLPGISLLVKQPVIIRLYGSNRTVPSCITTPDGRRELTSSRRVAGLRGVPSAANCCQTNVVSSFQARMWLEADGRTRG